MNCKPGDLAIILRDGFPENVGRVVTVIRPSGAWELEAAIPGDFHWEVDCATPLAIGYYDRHAGKLVGPTYHRRQGTVLDRDLRPIRDPGEGATDETLLWLPSPTKQGEPA
jgi:hypothetical protein